MERLKGVPANVFAYDMLEDVWDCNASSMDWLLNRLLVGLEKFTEALKDVPGRFFGSCVWLHRMEKSPDSW